MDRLGDLNLINASPVCSQGHVPFCQDIRHRLARIRDSLRFTDIAGEREETVASLARSDSDRDENFLA